MFNNGDALLPETWDEDADEAGSSATAVHVTCVVVWAEHLEGGAIVFKSMCGDGLTAVLLPTWLAESSGRRLLMPDDDRVTTSASASSFSSLSRSSYRSNAHRTTVGALTVWPASARSSRHSQIVCCSALEGSIACRRLRHTTVFLVRASHLQMTAALSSFTGPEGASSRQMTSRFPSSFKSLRVSASTPDGSAVPEEQDDT